jgi:hypothetical protein
MYVRDEVLVIISHVNLLHVLYYDLLIIDLVFYGIQFLKGGGDSVMDLYIIGDN